MSTELAEKVGMDPKAEKKDKQAAAEKAERMKAIDLAWLKLRSNLGPVPL
jgi:hypothetical protein